MSRPLAAIPPAPLWDEEQSRRWNTALNKIPPLVKIAIEGMKSETRSEQLMGLNCYLATLALPAAILTRIFRKKPVSGVNAGS